MVYGRHAIAVPAPVNIRTKVQDTEDEILLMIPSWGVEYRLDKNPKKRQSFEKPAGLILDQMGLSKKGMKIEVFSDIPRGMGLGGSAAIAVSIIKALNNHFKLALNQDEINEILPEPTIEELKNNYLYEKIFDEIDSLALQSIQAIQNNDFELLGQLMNINHGLLNTLQVSTPELERLIMIARESGALGAKLTGGGGGGAVIALCKDIDITKSAIESEGYETLVVEIHNP